MTGAVDPRSWRDLPGSGVGILLAAIGLLYLPLAFLGYGNDIDVPNLLRAGRAFMESGHYEMSRGPGEVITEVGVGVLDRVGGSVLVNLTTVGFALLALWALFQLVRDDGARWPAWSVAVLAANPWFIIAATSLLDSVWSLAMLLTGVHACRRHRRVVGGLLFAVSIGMRGSTVVLVLAWFVAERLGAPDRRPPWKATLTTAAIGLGVGLLWFVPPWLAADRSSDFLDNQLDYLGLSVHLGRWAVKNAAVAGLLAGIVLLVGLPRLFGALARWRQSDIVRFAALILVVSEILFFRFPFKPTHLLPVVLATALFVGASPLVTHRWVTALVVAELISALVGTTIASPDVVDAARGGQLEVAITHGVLLRDVQCRLDDRQDGPWVHPELNESTQRAAENARCQSRSWRASPENQQP